MFAIIIVEILDHFGLDLKDIEMKKDDFRYDVGFASWWILQHRKGYKPFITQVNVRYKISGAL